MSMTCRPMWPFLLTYGSHDMRHTGFPRVDGLSTNPRGSGRHSLSLGILNPLEDMFLQPALRIVILIRVYSHN